MAWIPAIVVSRRTRCCRTRGGGAIAAAVAILLVFGLLFFIAFNRFNGFMPPMWLMMSGLGIVILVIVGMSVIAASMSENYKKPKEKIFKSPQVYPQRQSPKHNPYIVRNSIQERTEKPLSEETIKEIPVIAEIMEINYCQLCGAKRERDSIFCHQCGNKFFILN